MRFAALLLVCLCVAMHAQDPVGILEGQVRDPADANISGAEVTIQNLQTGYTVRQQTTRDGSFRFPNVPVGEYALRVENPGFSVLSAGSVRVDIGRVVRLSLRMEITTQRSEVNVVPVAQTTDLGTALGNVVSSREALDLPLNGRDLTQLGRLQPGVAPLTAGLAQAGGIARSGQAFAVNGQRPESNNYLLDGVNNVDSVNGGYALRMPVDAVTEFRILTANAPAEYGETSGSTVSVVTKSGANQFHGDVYDFLRNDAFDARNFFAQSTEPLHRNQFGATLGGPFRKNKDFFFVYYEGQRLSQGQSQAGIVPSEAQRHGDFSGLIDPATGQPKPLINGFTGMPFPGNQIPAFLQDPISLNAEKLIPLPNIGPQLFATTQIMTINYDQGGARFDHYFGNGDTLFARYATSQLDELDPLPVSGAGVPGFPVADNITTNSFTMSHVHSFSPAMVQTARVAFFRNAFMTGAAQNHTSGSSLGFAYQPTLSTNAGIPYFIVSGYASFGNPITGPQITYQNDYEGSYSLAWTRGSHSIKLGAELRRQQINATLGIATNGFFVFAPFPASDSFASFLLGQSVQFFQGGGDFNRGLRKWIVAGYAQDEWRINRRLTLNYGLRYEVNTPYSEIRGRLNAWVPGAQSTVMPTAPPGLLFPGDAGVPDAIAPVSYTQLMPRVGLAWDPIGDARTTFRAAYGIFYDGYTNGVGGPLQAAVSALPWTEAYQIPGPGFDLADPYGGATPPFVTQTFVRPATILTVQSGMKPVYSQNWNFSMERLLGRDYLFDARYVGSKGTHLPRFIEANPSIYANNDLSIDQRRIHAGCAPDGSCTYGSVGLIANNANSTYHALQIALSRQFQNGLSFLASYWWSKSLDYISTLNVAGSAPKLVAGENDLAQNPFNLAAEHGPSLFDATHRFVLSGTYALPKWRSAPKLAGIAVNGWQLNTITTLSSGTPFTVYDSANVSQQGSAPEITGFYSSRPSLVSDPNRGPHTPNRWVSRSAFQQLDPVTQAGQFGNEGRNVVRGPGIQTVDLSVFKEFIAGEATRIQFRVEAFNTFNHANFGLPENDLQSPAFGQILQAGPPRLLQLGLKILF